MLKIAFTLFLLPALLPAGSKDRDWQSGRVLDNNANPYFAMPAIEPQSGGGTYADMRYQINNQNLLHQPVFDHYVIETEDSVYLVERIRVKLSSPANVKRYTMVKFAVEKKKLWLVDGDGKQLETRILEQKRKS
jgi:hypothetical protein